jgi:IclR family KDG regulon transcriptional repressor
MQKRNPYSIEVLGVALDVVERLLTTREPQSTSKLARDLGINRTRVLRILKTLEDRGYVQVNSETQEYRLGLKFLEAGEHVRDQLDIYQVAKPVLRELAQDTGDSAVLVVLFGRSAVCIDAYQGENLLQAEDPIGQPLPLHIGASPKILLAYLPKEQRERIIDEMELPSFTPKTITDREELRHHLEEIRQQGYAVDVGDLEVGVCATGAPVRDYTGRVVAGITVTTPASRYDPHRRQELIERVIGAADRISARLGWAGQS